MATRVAQGGFRTLLGIGSYDRLFAEGQAGELHIGMKLVPPGLVPALQRSLVLFKAPLTAPVRADGNTIIISFRRSLAPLVLIGFALSAAFVGLTLFLVVTWALYQEDAPEIAGKVLDIPGKLIKGVEGTLGTVGVAAVLAFLAYSLLTRQKG